MALSVSIEKKLGAFTLAVSFTTQEGMLGLLGQSGSGKSVTLQCIAGTMTPDRGRIVLGEQVLFDSALQINLPPQQRHVGYLFQHYALFPHWTVAQNLQVIDSGQTGVMLSNLGLESVAKLKPHQISGGQRQRLALGRMLLAKPQVVLLDEPLAALDGHLAWDVECQLHTTLAELDCPVVWVSHDPGEIRRNCSDICVMDGGKSQDLVATKTLFTYPQTMAAAQMAGIENVIPQALSPWPIPEDAGLCVRGADLQVATPETVGAIYCDVVRDYEDGQGNWTVLRPQTSPQITLRMVGQTVESQVWVAPKQGSVQRLK